jgi:PAS domain S-box-containing protein
VGGPTDAGSPALGWPAIIVTDGDGTVTFWNAAAEDLYGWTAEEAVGRPVIDLAVAPDDTALAGELMAQVMAGEPWQGAFPVTRKDGTVVQAFVRDVPVLDHDGNVVAVVGTSAGQHLVGETSELLDPSIRSDALLDALFDALLWNAPIGLAFFDTELRYLQLNQRLAEINGLPVEEHYGRTVPEVLPDMSPEVVAALHRVLETGVPLVDLDVVGITPADPHHHRNWVVSYFPVSLGGGTVIGLGAVVVETTEQRTAQRALAESEARLREALGAAEAARDRLAFLAQASLVLDSSLDYQATLDRVARLCVPFIGDSCVVDVFEDGGLRRVGIAADDEARLQALIELRRRWPRDPARPNPADRVARTGRTEVFTTVDDGLLTAVAQDPEHRATLDAVQAASAATVPIVVRGRPVGAITVSRRTHERTVNDADVALLEDLGRRAGLAIDNARQYSERVLVTQKLQTSLVPPNLPGLDVAARYLAAGELEVGGDFYDVFALDGEGRRWAAVIGDVSGKGPDAAAMTGLVRHTVRAVTGFDAAPTAVLGALNEALLRESDPEGFCTIVYALVDLVDDGAALTFGVGGHPLPRVVAPGGTVRAVGTAGSIIGAFPRPRDHRDHRCPRSRRHPGPLHRRRRRAPGRPPVPRRGRPRCGPRPRRGPHRGRGGRRHPRGGRRLPGGRAPRRHGRPRGPRRRVTRAAGRSLPSPDDGLRLRERHPQPRLPDVRRDDERR